MRDFSTTLHLIVQSCILQFPFVMTILAILWGVQLCNALVGYRLNYLGLVPRSSIGLIGIITSPFLHGSFEHLFMNSVVLFILLNLMLLFGHHIWLVATLSIMVISGGLVWCFGRRAIHVGASGVVMGYWGFLIVSAYHMGSMLSILIALICLYFFSSLIFNIFPSDRRSSWEGHLFGLVAGIITAWLV